MRHEPFRALAGEQCVGHADARAALAGDREEPLEGVSVEEEHGGVHDQLRRGAPRPGRQARLVARAAFLGRADDGGDRAAHRRERGAPPTRPGGAQADARDGARRRRSRGGHAEPDAPRDRACTHDAPSQTSATSSTS